MYSQSRFTKSRYPRYRKNPRKLRVKKSRAPRQPESKSHFNATTETLTYMPAFSQQPFPSRYKTKVHCSCYGSIASGAGSGDAHFAFPLNSPLFPFNDSAAVTWNNITPATYNPTGFSALCNTNLYKAYRVYGSSITINCTPQSVTDSVLCSLTPSSSQTNPTNVTISLDQPHSRNALFSSGRSIGKRNDLTNYIPVHKFYGVTPRAIQDDLSGEFIGGVGANPTNLLWWVVNLETPDNSVFTQPLELEVRMCYYIEFFADVNATMIQT